jgi:hypothetical protein
MSVDEFDESTPSSPLRGSTVIFVMSVLLAFLGGYAISTSTDKVAEESQHCADAMLNISLRTQICDAALVEAQQCCQYCDARMLEVTI